MLNVTALTTTGLICDHFCIEQIGPGSLELLINRFVLNIINIEGALSVLLFQLDFLNGLKRSSSSTGNLSKKSGSGKGRAGVTV